MKTLTIFAYAMLVWTATARAEDKLTPERLLDKTVEAMGGAAFKEMKSLASSGTLQIEGADVQGTCSIHAKAPGMSRMTVRITDMMDSTEACDGTVGWDYNPFFAVFRQKEGNEAAYMLLHSRTDLLTNYKSHFVKWETLGKKTVKGRECHVLKLTPKGKVQPFLYYIDAETFLLKREESVFDGPQGTFSIVSDIDEYQKVDGVNVPQKLTVNMSQMNVKVSFTSINVNEVMPDMLFKNPDGMTVAIRQINALEYQVGKDDPVTMNRKQLLAAFKTVNSVKEDFKVNAIVLSGADGVDAVMLRASSYWMRNLADEVTVLETEKTDGAPANTPTPVDNPATEIAPK